LLAQLTAVKTMLLQRRGRLDPGQIQGPLQQYADAIGAELTAKGVPDAAPAQAAHAIEPAAMPDPFEDLSPWLVRRLQMARDIARQVRGEAKRALAALQAS
jgi:hypothetical protein